MHKAFTARRNLGREMIEVKKVVVKYVKADEMKADKPLGPSGHNKFTWFLDN
jgi:hypothetical protein